MGVKSSFVQGAPQQAKEPEMLGIQAIYDSQVKPGLEEKRPDVKITINWPADLHSQIVDVKNEEFCDFSSATRMLVLEALRMRSKKKKAAWERR